MACGDRYKHLAVTTDGYTPENPYGAFIVPFRDYAQWRSLAEKLTGIVNEHVVMLQAVEAKKAPTLPEFTRVNEARATLLSNLEALPSVVGSGTMPDAEPIDLALAVVAEALCVLEQADDAIEGYSERAPEVPGVTPTPKKPGSGPDQLRDWAITLAIVAALGVGGYFLFKSGTD